MYKPDQNEEIVICKHCRQPEYWGAMRWLDGRCMCRRCYKADWESRNHSVYEWNDLDGPVPTLHDYNSQTDMK